MVPSVPVPLFSRQCAAVTTPEPKATLFHEPVATVFTQMPGHLMAAFPTSPVNRSRSGAALFTREPWVLGITKDCPGPLDHPSLHPEVESAVLGIPRPTLRVLLGSAQDALDAGGLQPVPGSLRGAGVAVPSERNEVCVHGGPQPTMEGPLRSLPSEP
jgi:hypothetical protein